MYFLFLLFVTLNSKNVEFSVKATWNKPTIISEASEYFSQHPALDFWDLVDAPPVESGSGVYFALLERVSEKDRSLFEYSLSINYYSPLVATFQRLGESALNSATLELSTATFLYCGTSALFTDVSDFSVSKCAASDVEVYEFDHLYREPFNDEKPTCVLYSDILAPATKGWHDVLKNSDVNYLFRHYFHQNVPRTDHCTSKTADELLSLQGYGIELQVKNLEYRTMDPKVRPKAQAPSNFGGIRFEYLIEKYPEEKYGLETLRVELMKNDQEMGIAGVKAWELADLGVRASQVIMDSDDSVHMLKEISQNFPSYVGKIGNSFNKDLKEEIKSNQQHLTPGETEIFLGGRKIDLEEETTIFSLYDMLRDQLSLYHSVQFLLLQTEEMSSLIDLVSVEEDFVRYDILKDVVWLNDVENDQRYEQFPSSVRTLLQPPYYGRRGFPRSNIFNFILAIDPTTKIGMDAVASVMGLMKQNAPFRFGFIMMDFAKDEKKIHVDVGLDGDVIGTKKVQPVSVASKIAAAFRYVSEKKSPSEAAEFVLFFKDSVYSPEGVTEKGFEEEFVRHAPKDMKVYEFLPENKKAASYFVSTRPETFPSFQFVSFNGVLIDLQTDSFSNILNSNLMGEYDRLKVMVQEREITDKTKNMLSTILEIFDAEEKYGSLESTNGVSLIPLNSVDVLKSKTFKFFSSEMGQSSNLGKKSSFYVCSTWENGVDGSLDDLMQFVETQNDNGMAKVALLFNGNEPSSRAKWLFHRIEESSKLLHLRFDGSSFKDDSNILTKMEKQSEICSSFGSEEMFIIMNGLKIVPTEGSIILLETLIGAVKYRSNVISPIHEMLKLSFDDFLIFCASTIVLNYYNPSSDDFSRKTDSLFKSVKKEHSAIVSNMNNRHLLPEVFGYIDPLTKKGQKYASFISLFVDHFKLPVTILLNPQSSFSELPIKSWYRFVLDPSAVSNSENSSPKAFFEDLPSTYILTVYTDEPETWLLESTFAEHDLDNLNLDHVSEGETMSGRYQLENIILTGSCLDTTQKRAPRGLQFELVPHNFAIQNNVWKAEKIQDTLVMANLGYFQLKANPNVFQLRLGERGLNSKVFEFEKVGISNKLKQIDQDGQIPIYITHFDGPYVDLKVARLSGMEDVELFESGSGGKKKSGIWNTLFGSEKEEEGEETINIFSVASGHLYERLLKIMIRSVRQTTTKTEKIKFWIIKNYLSPQFKEFLPHMAERYNFEFEFVTYKWPTWLNKQTNKIRIIWAYKILFLDVLFPQNVRKIIYVDSDQVTRGDLTDLWNIDMQNKAVAYTPFCKDKPEMDGYAFWKQGYWKNHLKGKPYHISALYVVDIEMLRRKYFGDQYRVIYDNLSKDPGSLSNLDQDLPNFAQHMIPIRSLPQEWLWCETWCNQQSKKKAKTIDLCNNPQTKEHKVSQAKRIVNVNNDWDFNWEDLDNEITLFTEEIEKEYGIVTK